MKRYGRKKVWQPADLSAEETKVLEAWGGPADALHFAGLGYVKAMLKFDKKQITNGQMAFIRATELRYRQLVTEEE